MESIRELKQRRAKLVTDAGAILDTAQGAKRDLTPDEERRYDDLHAQAAKVAADIAEAEAAEADMLRRASTQHATEGREVTERTVALTREQHVTDWSRARGRIKNDYEGLSLGGYLRSLVIGPQSEVEHRALSEGTLSAGGYTVPEILAVELIDRFRARATVMRAGATTIPLDSNKQYIARLTGDPVASWRNESAAIGSSDPTFDRVAFTARSLAAQVIASRELLEDTVNIETALDNALTQAMALEVDRVALRGSGVAPEPQGLRTLAGVSEKVMGVNGAAITNYDPFLDVLQNMQDANALDPTAFIMAPRTARVLNGLKDSTTQPLRRPPALEPFPFYATTQVPVNEAQGTANNASTVYTGNFRELLIGVRTTLSIEVLKERYADLGQIGLIAWMRADVQAAHAASFARIIGVIP